MGSPVGGLRISSMLFLERVMLNSFAAISCLFPLAFIRVLKSDSRSSGGLNNRRGQVSVMTEAINS